MGQSHLQRSFQGSVSASNMGHNQGPALADISPSRKEALDLFVYQMPEMAEPRRILVERVAEIGGDGMGRTKSGAYIEVRRCVFV